MHDVLAPAPRQIDPQLRLKKSDEVRQKLILFYYHKPRNLGTYCIHLFYALNNDIVFKAKHFETTKFRSKHSAAYDGARGSNN